MSRKEKNKKFYLEMEKNNFLLSMKKIYFFFFLTLFITFFQKCLLAPPNETFESLKLSYNVGEIGCLVGLSCTFRITAVHNPMLIKVMFFVELHEEYSPRLMLRRENNYSWVAESSLFTKLLSEIPILLQFESTSHPYEKSNLYRVGTFKLKGLIESVNLSIYKTSLLRINIKCLNYEKGEKVALKLDCISSALWSEDKKLSRYLFLDEIERNRSYDICKFKSVVDDHFVFGKVYNVCSCEYFYSTSCTKIENYVLTAGKLITNEPKNLNLNFLIGNDIKLQLKIQASQKFNVMVRNTCVHDEKIALKSSNNLLKLDKEDNTYYLEQNLDKNLLKEGNYKICICLIFSADSCLEPNDFTYEFGSLKMLKPQVSTDGCFTENYCYFSVSNLPSQSYNFFITKNTNCSNTKHNLTEIYSEYDTEKLFTKKLQFFCNLKKGLYNLCTESSVEKTNSKQNSLNIFSIWMLGVNKINKVSCETLKSCGITIEMASLPRSDKSTVNTTSVMIRNSTCEESTNKASDLVKFDFKEAFVHELNETFVTYKIEYSVNILKLTENEYTMCWVPNASNYVLLGKLTATGIRYLSSPIHVASGVPFNVELEGSHASKGGMIIYIPELARPNCVNSTSDSTVLAAKNETEFSYLKGNATANNTLTWVDQVITVSRDNDFSSSVFFNICFCFSSFDCSNIDKFSVSVGQIFFSAPHVIRYPLMFPIGVRTSLNVSGVRLSKSDRILIASSRNYTDHSLFKCGHSEFQYHQIFKPSNQKLLSDEFVIFDDFYIGVYYEKFKLCWCTGVSCDTPANFKTYFADIDISAKFEYIRQNVLPYGLTQVEIADGAYLLDVIRLFNHSSNCGSANSSVMSDGAVRIPRFYNFTDPNHLGKADTMNLLRKNAVFSPWRSRIFQVSIDEDLPAASKLLKICYCNSFDISRINPLDKCHNDTDFLTDIGIITVSGPTLGSMSFKKLLSNDFNITIKGKSLEPKNMLRIEVLKENVDASKMYDCKLKINYMNSSKPTDGKLPIPHLNLLEDTLLLDPFSFANNTLSFISSFHFDKTYLICWCNNEQDLRSNSCHFMKKYRRNGVFLNQRVDLVVGVFTNFPVFGFFEDHTIKYELVITNSTMFSCDEFHKNKHRLLNNVYESPNSGYIIFKNVRFKNVGYYSLCILSSFDPGVAINYGTIVVKDYFRSSLQQLTKTNHLLLLPCLYGSEFVVTVTSNEVSFLKITNSTTPHYLSYDYSLSITKKEESVLRKTSNFLACEFSSDLKTFMILTNDSFILLRNDIFHTMFFEGSLFIDFAVYGLFIFLTDVEKNSVVIFNLKTLTIITEFTGDTTAKLMFPAGIDVVPVDEGSTLSLSVCVADLNAATVNRLDFSIDYNTYTINVDSKWSFIYGNDYSNMTKADLIHYPFSVSSYISKTSKKPFTLLFVGEMITKRIIVLIAGKSTLMPYKTLNIIEADIISGIRFLGSYILLSTVNWFTFEGKPQVYLKYMDISKYADIPEVAYSIPKELISNEYYFFKPNLLVFGHIDFYLESGNKKNGEGLQTVGLALNETDGTISGTLKGTGRFRFSVTVGNYLGVSTADFDFRATCPRGMEFIKSECLQCEIGWYRFNEDYCKSCERYMNHTTTQQKGSIFKDNCLCKPGYYLNTTTKKCDMCPAGHYKSEIHNFECQNTCPLNMESSVRGASSLDELKCSCIPGYFLKDKNYNDGSCEECDVGFYCEGGMSLPKKCSAKTTTINKGSSKPESCLCDVGYRYDSIEKRCIACDRNEWKNRVGNENCTSCTISASFSLEEAKLKSNHSSHINDSIGTIYTEKKGAVSKSDCIFCPSGTYFNHISQNCNACPLNAYCPGQQSNRLRCGNKAITEFTGSNSIFSCMCGKGYKMISNNRKNLLKQVTCKKCPMNTFQHLNYTDSPCIPCPENSKTVHEGSYSLSQCVVLPGFAQRNAIFSVTNIENAESYNFTSKDVSFNCTTTGQFKTSAKYEYTVFRDSLATCFNSCIANVYCTGIVFNLLNSTNVFYETFDFKGSYINHLFPCTILLFGNPVLSEIDNNLNIHNMYFTIKKGKISCLVSRTHTKYSSINMITIAPCPTNSFCYGGYAATKSLCPNFSVTKGQRKTKESHCLCIKGYESREVGHVVCEKCMKGYYKDSIDFSNCISCKGNFTTVGTGSTSKHQCVCKPGYYFSEQCLNDEDCLEVLNLKGNKTKGSCLECPVNMYCPGFWLDKLETIHSKPILCLKGSKILLQNKQAESVASCLCIKGYGYVYNNSSMKGYCEKCSSGLFKETLDNTACTNKCMQYGETIPGAVNIKQCYCSPNKHIMKRPNMDLYCETCPNGAICPGGFHPHIFKKIKENHEFVDIKITDHILIYPAFGFFAVFKDKTFSVPWHPSIYYKHLYDANTTNGTLPSSVSTLQITSKQNKDEKIDITDFFSDMHACPSTNACLGGTDNRCLNGNTGYLCSECLPGYDRKFFGSLCYKCHNNYAYIIIEVFKKCIIFLLVSIIVYYSYLSARKQIVTHPIILRIWLNFLFSMSINGTLKSRSVSFMANFADLYHFFFFVPTFYFAGPLMPSCFFRRFHGDYFTDYRTAWYMQQILYFLKPLFYCILYTFLCAIIKILYKWRYCNEINAVHKILEEAKHNFSEKEWIEKISPVYSHKCFGIFKYISPPNTTMYWRIKEFFYDLIPAYVVILFISYPFQCIAFVETIWCVRTKYKNEPYIKILFSLPSQECNFNDPYFLSGFILGLAGLILWGISIPLTYCFWQTKLNCKHSFQNKLNYGFLDEGYNYSTRAWETFCFLRKLSLATLIAARLHLDPKGESEYFVSSVNLLITTIALTLQISVEPYDKRCYNLLNRLELFSLIVATFTAFIMQGSFFYDLELFGLLPVILHILFNVYVIWCLFVESGRLLIFSSSFNLSRQMPAPWIWFATVGKIAAQLHKKKVMVYYDHKTRDITLNVYFKPHLNIFRSIKYEKQLTQPGVSIDNRDYLVTCIAQSMSQLVLTHSELRIPGDWLDFVMRYSFCYFYWYRHIRHYDHDGNDMNSVRLPWDGFIELEKPSIFFESITLQKSIKKASIFIFPEAKETEISKRESFTKLIKNHFEHSSSDMYLESIYKFNRDHNNFEFSNNEDCENEPLLSEAEQNFLDMMFDDDTFNDMPITISQIYIAVLSMKMLTKEKLLRLHSIFRNKKLELDYPTKLLCKQNAEIEIEVKQLNKALMIELDEHNTDFSFDILDFFYISEEIKTVKEKIKQVEDELKKEQEDLLASENLQTFAEQLQNDLICNEMSEEELLSLLDVAEKKKNRSNKGGRVASKKCINNMNSLNKSRTFDKSITKQVSLKKRLKSFGTKSISFRNEESVNRELSEMKTPSPPQKKKLSRPKCNYPDLTNRNDKKCRTVKKYLSKKAIKIDEIFI